MDATLHPKPSIHNPKFYTARENIEGSGNLDRRMLMGGKSPMRVGLLPTPYITYLGFRVFGLFILSPKQILGGVLSKSRLQNGGFREKGAGQT